MKPCSSRKRARDAHDQLHRVVGRADDAGGEEQPLDVVALVEIEREVDDLLHGKARAPHVRGAAVDAVGAIEHAGIGEQDLRAARRSARPAYRSGRCRGWSSRARHSSSCASPRRRTRRRRRIWRRRPGFRASAASKACSLFVLIRLRSQARARRSQSKFQSGRTHGLSQSRPQRREGLAALPRHHDVRRPDRRGDRGPHRRQGAASRASTSSTRPTPTRAASPRRSPAARSATSATTGCWRPSSPTRWARAPNRGGLSRKWVMQAAEESLRRLGTDYIDIYYLHKEDHATPLAETVRAIGDLLRAGQDPLLRRVELHVLARRRDLQSVRPDGHRPADREPALLSRALSRGGGRAAAGLRLLRARRGELFAARARRAHRQVPAGRRSRRRTRAPAAPTGACCRPNSAPRRLRRRRR